MAIKLQNIHSKKIIPTVNMKVKIKNNLRFNETYNRVLCITENVKMKNKIVTITEIHPYRPDVFKLDHSCAWFQKSMVTFHSNGVVH